MVRPGKVTQSQDGNAYQCDLVQRHQERTNPHSEPTWSIFKLALRSETLRLASICCATSAEAFASAFCKAWYLAYLRQ
eukprot:3937487-Rhodomonas_salina.1